LKEGVARYYNGVVLYRSRETAKTRQKRLKFILLYFVINLFEFVTDVLRNLHL